MAKEWAAAYVRLTPEQHEWASEHAAAEDVSLAWVIRRALDEYRQRATVKA